MNAKKLETILNRVCDGTTFGVNKCEDGDIWLNSDLGCEDINEEFNYEETDEIIDVLEEIKTTFQCYDPEEDFHIWYGANNGEPSNPGELWRHCEEKEEEYTLIADRIDDEIRKLNK